MSSLAHPVATMTTLELLDVVNAARAEFGEAVVRRNDFTERCRDELQGENYESFVVTNSNGTESEALRLTRDQCMYILMRESKAVRRSATARLNAMRPAALTPVAGPVDQTLTAAKLFPPLVRVARLIGCDKNAAAISANQAVEKITGTNMLQLLGRTHLEAANQEDLFFTPTELGKRMEPPATPRTVNLLLAEAGMQMKRDEVWEMTEAGKGLARILDTGKKHGSGVPVQQIKWAASVLPMLRGNKAA